LAEVDRRRFARHLLLAEIGQAGQARLCATRLRASEAADPRAAEVARDYLERAGVRVLTHEEERGREAQALALPSPAAVRALAGHLELEEAAAALAGAYAAVEAIKGALGMTVRAELPPGLVLGRETNA
jgi:hypothetical protein